MVLKTSCIFQAEKLHTAVATFATRGNAGGSVVALLGTRLVAPSEAR